jgi:DNA-binding transcriptional regulator WhiA
MSFAHDVKLEVLDNNVQSECCKLAFLSAVIHSCGELTKSGKEFFVELKTDIEKVYDIGIKAVFATNPIPEDFEKSRHKSEENLAVTVENIIRILSFTSPKNVKNCL